MKRTTLLLIPSLLLVVLVAAVAAEIPDRAGLPTGVQTRLDQYLASPFALGKGSVRSVQRARRPWNFSEDMSYMVLGDSVYFQTDSPLTWTEGGGPSPLPFPPRELWCALLELENDATGERFYAVIYVGLHMDMYNGDWMVHKGPGGLSIQGSRERLATIGCDFEDVMHD